MVGAERVSASVSVPIPKQPRAPAGWNDLPGELHREILRLVPLADAKAARQVSREMRDEVDEVWRAWGIRATMGGMKNALREHVKRCTREMELDCVPLAVYAFDGSHAHHLASLGLWWLAELVAEASNLNGISWTVRHEWDIDQSPLVVAVRARRPVGRGAGGEVEWAYALGDEEVARMVRGALAMGADVNRRLHGAWPLMTYCAGRGCLEAVKACLAAGAEVDAASGDFCRKRWTALVHAAYWAHEAVVQVLLEAGASALVGPCGRNQALAYVCQGHPTPGIVRWLAEAGADVQAEDGGLTALAHAVRNGDLPVMEMLVKLGATAGLFSWRGRTVMHVAADGEVVRWLAGHMHGAGVQGVDGYLSPLQAACKDGRIDAVRALIKMGANVRYASAEGLTALHVAVCGPDEQAALESTRLLLAAGADVGAADVRGRTPLHLVEHAPCAEALLDAGAVLGTRDAEGRTPLLCAALRFDKEAHARHLRVISCMASRGAMPLALV